MKRSLILIPIFVVILASTSPAQDDTHKEKQSEAAEKEKLAVDWLNYLEGNWEGILIQEEGPVGANPKKFTSSTKKMHFEARLDKAVLFFQWSEWSEDSRVPVNAGIMFWDPARQMAIEGLIPGKELPEDSEDRRRIAEQRYSRSVFRKTLEFPEIELNEIQGFQPLLNIWKYEISIIKRGTRFVREEHSEPWDFALENRKKYAMRRMPKQDN